MSRAIATLFGVGYLSPAPGTWGSAAAVILAYVLHFFLTFPAFAALTVLAFFLGWWATREMTRDSDNEDPSEIVIDELAGQWVALWAVSWGAWNAGVDATALWPGWIVAFVAFRVFDVWKAGPVGWADRRGDALGVMLDDVFAGVIAALVTALLAALWHGVLMA